MDGTADMFTGNGASEITLMAGILKTADGGVQIQNIADLTHDTPSSTDMPAVLATIKAAKQYADAAGCPTEDIEKTVYDSILSQTMEAQLNYALHKTYATVADSAGRSELQQMAKTIIGATAENFKNTFIKDLLQSELEFPQELKLTSNTIQKIPGSKLQEVTAFLIQQSATKEPEPKQCTGKKAAATQSTSETDESCEAKGTGNKCKPPCKVVDKDGTKKCKLDKEAATKVAEQATKEDGKATNTTASNSFLINKAPLLLAVLLLG